MRELKQAEQTKRGCKLCADVEKIAKKGKYPRRHCPYDKCPYHELDGFKTYKDYLISVSDDPVSNIIKELGLE